MVIMSNNSFVNLLKEEKIKNINIDSRLIDSFKRVMNKLQVYFDANGYTSQRNYEEFFEEYLLKEMPDKLKIVVSCEPSKIGADGFYRHRNLIQEIHVDEFCLDYGNEYLDSVLCHEFIHFLVMRGLDKIDFPDPEIKNGGFVNEALTEMLTQQIYPNSRAYEPQVNMLKFANLLTGNVNNYSLFLKGKVDCKGGASSWLNFFQFANAYYKIWKDKGFIMSQAINDKNYLEAQRYIIRANISAHLISSFEEYEKWINILQQRPALDNEFMEQFFINMDQCLINNLGLKNKELQELMLQQLLEYRQTSSKLIKQGDKDIYEFEIAGHKIGINKDRKLFGERVLGGYSTSWNPNTGIYVLKKGDESITLDMNAIDFKKGKKDLLEKQRTIAKYFLPTSKDDVKAVSQVAQTEGLIKLEKFTLPIVGVDKKVPTVIYVATYGDRIEILNNPTKIGEMEDVNEEQYIGVTSPNPKNAAIYFEPLGNIDRGIVYSKYTEKYLTNRTIYNLAQQIVPTLSQEQLSYIVKQYKESPEFDLDEELTEKQIQDYAIIKYAKEYYYNLPLEQRQKLLNEYAKSQERFIISTKDGKVDISLLFGNEFITAFKAQSEVLVSLNSNGLYNNHYNILSQDKTLPNQPSSEVININSDGNIVFLQTKDENAIKTITTNLVNSFEQEHDNQRKR